MEAELGYKTEGLKVIEYAYKQGGYEEYYFMKVIIFQIQILCLFIFIE